MIELERVPASAGPGSSGELRAGAAEVDITPHIGLPMAGYSAQGHEAEGVSGRLFARALALIGEDGESVALCVTDLMSASRYVLEKAATITAASCGIGVDRLILMGTHTHTGPAWFYGNTLYDTFAAKEPGFDRGLADWLAGKIARAVTEAMESAVPAKVGTAQEQVWGVSRNRSIGAFLAHPLCKRWATTGFPAEHPPKSMHLTYEQLAVDPRLRVLAAYRQSDGGAIGAIGFFGAHVTSIGVDAEYYSADCAGYAARKARWDIERDGGGRGAVVALATAAAGDVNTLRYGLSPEVSPGPMLARHVGIALGRTIGRLVKSARTDAAAAPVQVAFTEPAHTAPLPGGNDQTRLADKFAFGAPTIAGSEESRTLLHDLGLAEEPQRSKTCFDPDDPQHPKALGLGPVQVILAGLLDLEPTPVMPLYQLRVGPLLLATVPGEPTTLAAYQIETALLKATEAEGVVVVGYAGDYGGYFTTEEEYGRQYYEGSSTLLGRYVTNYLTARHRLLADGVGTITNPSGTVRFDTGQDREEFKAQSDCRAIDRIDARVERRGPRVDVAWRMRRGSTVVFAEGWFLRVEERVGANWVPLNYLGRDFDDREHAIHIRQVSSSLDFNPFVAHERWKATIFLPRAVWDDTPDLRVVVAPRDEFPGFSAAVPRV